MADEEAKMEQQQDLPVLGKADVLDRDDRAYELVPVPEWRGAVWIRSLSAKEVFAWQREIRKGQGVDEEKALGLLVARSVVEAEGSGARLFEDADMPRLLTRNTAALSRISGAALRLNKIREEDVKALLGN